VTLTVRLFGGKIMRGYPILIRTMAIGAPLAAVAWPSPAAAQAPPDTPAEAAKPVFTLAVMRR